MSINPKITPREAGAYSQIHLRWSLRKPDCNTRVSDNLEIHLEIFLL